MSVQLKSLQRILDDLGIQSYYWGVSEERSRPMLVVEIQSTEDECNHLEICEIAIPETELFLLQSYVQLPLSPPFGPNDELPDFLRGDVLQYIAALNHVLPIMGFSCVEGKLCFRHIFPCEFMTPTQLQYLIETIEQLIQYCQPSIQQVAIGSLDLQDAIHNIPTLFNEPFQE